MHLIFINYNIFEGNSGIHIHPLANELVKLGHKVTVFVPASPEKGCTLNNKQLYDIRAFSDHRRLEHKGDIAFIAWTPREIVRKKTVSLAEEYHSPYYVHLEDNEEQIIVDNLKIPWPKLLAANAEELDKIIPENISHPHRYRDFLHHATGVTCIFKTLEEFVPKKTPAITFLPACEDEIFDIPLEHNDEIRKELGIKPDETVIFYPGNMHLSNASDVTALYEAISILNKNGKKVILIRTGQNYTNFDKLIDINNQCFLEMGERPLNENFKYISASDILVQPGSRNNFNNYRFPSKLPMFLASARPLIIGEINIGEFLTDWTNCLKFSQGDPHELAHKISLLIENPNLAIEIGKEGRLFAKENFSWIKSAGILNEFIKTTYKKKVAII
jgi:glycosyltransferase involved in cell wall biosynthesis